MNLPFEDKIILKFCQPHVKLFENNGCAVGECPGTALPCLPTEIDERSQLNISWTFAI